MESKRPCRVFEPPGLSRGLNALLAELFDVDFSLSKTWLRHRPGAVAPANRKCLITPVALAPAIHRPFAQSIGIGGG